MSSPNLTLLKFTKITYRIRDGKLILFEITNAKSLRSPFAFGVHKSWWSANESGRYENPCLSEDSWAATLKENGFSSVDLMLPDHENAEWRESSVIVASANDLGEDKNTHLMSECVVILRDEKVEGQKLLSSTLTSILREQALPTFETDLVNIENMNLGDNIVISLLEVESAFLYGINASDWGSAQALFRRVRRLLWISRSSGENPCSSLIAGLGRTLRSENPQMKLISVWLDNFGYTVRDVADNIKLLIKSLSRSDSHNIDYEYEQSVDGFLSSRLRPVSALNRMIAAKCTKLIAEPIVLGGNIPLRLEVGRTGVLDSLHFHEVLLSGDGLHEYEALLRVEAVPITKRDGLVATAKTNDSRFGLFAVGTVEHSGQDGEFPTGSRVVATCCGTFQNLLTCKKSQLVLLPPNLNSLTAASTVEAGVIVVHALKWLPSLKSSQTALIDCASCEVGQVAIQLLRRQACKVIATVDSSERLFALQRRFAHDSRVTLLISNDAVLEQILDVTGGKGADVIIACDGISETPLYGALSELGCFVDLRTPTNEKGAEIVLSDFKSITKSRVQVNLAKMVQHEPEYVKETLSEVLDLMHEECLGTPSPVQSLSFSGLPEAFERLQKSSWSGSLVFEFDPQIQVNVSLPPTSSTPSIFTDSFRRRSSRTRIVGRSMPAQHT